MKSQTGAIGAILGSIGRAGIKSAYRYIYRNTGTDEGGGSDGAISINTVDPAKCIVLVERMRNASNTISEYSYELSADSITVHHSNWAASGMLILGFTVVEFYEIGGQ